MKEPIAVTPWITPRTVFTLLAAVVGIWVAWQIREFILVILASVVVAAFIENGTRTLAKVRIPRFLAVVIMYVFGFAILAAILYIVVPIFLRELVEFVELFPPQSTIANVFAPLTDFIAVVKTSGLTISSDPFYILSRLASEFTAFGFVQSAGAVFGGLLNLTLVFVFSFYFAIADRGIDTFLRAVTPVTHEPYVLSLWHRTERKVGLWFRGQVLLAILVSLITYLALVIMGVPYAFLLALLVFFFEFIPFGVIIATIPAVIIALLSDGIWFALIVMAVYFVIQQFESYVLQPYVIKRVTGVPSIVVLIALIAGIELAGIYGLLLSIPVAVLAVEIVRDREQARLAAMATENTPTL